MRILHPASWPRPKGYSNGIEAEGRLVLVSGMIGWDAENRIVSDDLVAQVRQALLNAVAVLSEAGAHPQHIVRMTWYVVDKDEYLQAAKQIGVVYREIIGKHYPAMTAVQVAALVEDRARVEIEVTAVVPAPPLRDPL